MTTTPHQAGPHQAGPHQAGPRQAGARVASLYRYPVKGLTPAPLDRVTLEAGTTMPLDRAWAIENGPGRFDPEAPRHLPKINFLMLMRDERLATLRSHFDDATTTLTLNRDGRQVARGDLSTPIGRKLVEQFLAAYMRDSLRGPPRIVWSAGHSFSDVAPKCLHIVNLASLRELERAAGRAIDPLRLRPNIIVDGAAAWDEFRWLGGTVRIGGVGLEVFHRTQRCDATNVDPTSGQRDMAIPSVLQRTWGHTDFGVYARVVTAGDMATGDAVVSD